jgi:hypothetical protein
MGFTFIYSFCLKRGDPWRKKKTIFAGDLSVMALPVTWVKSAIF